MFIRNFSLNIWYEYLEKSEEIDSPNFTALQSPSSPVSYAAADAFTM